MGIYSPQDIVVMSSPGANLWDANWSSSGSIITEWPTGQTGRFFSVAPGTGYFFVTNFNSCGDGPMYQGEVWVDESMMNSINPDIDFIVSPNPARDYINIDLTTDINDEKIYTYSVQFIDPYSRIIKETKLSGSHNRINIQNLTKGQYLIRLIYGKNVLTRTLIVQ